MSSKLAFGALIFFSLSLPWISWVVPTRRGESNFPGTWGAATSAPFDASLPSTTVSEATEACRYQPLCQVPLWIICLRTLLQSFSLRNAQNVNLKIFKKNIVKYDTHSISLHDRKFYLLPLCWRMKGSFLSAIWEPFFHLKTIICQAVTDLSWDWVWYY